ncbi:5'-3' exonuclease domain-containing protein [Reticulomyxa filosa]|uniref:5'-3' exonuclease domain-containing protein n=1 Tax=Reticulomyxa filosa TaxID=46433 RepID=X6LC95_RETFI|nr:5'-3' exonuclease domain-containing protein [Reticulomyxa filosa]|eukprot:ETN98349.1 5'-3' exonuclease domain-containing protein [Reticulomyxa filosa]
MCFCLYVIRVGIKELKEKKEDKKERDERTMEQIEKERNERTMTQIEELMKMLLDKTNETLTDKNATFTFREKEIRADINKRNPSPAAANKVMIDFSQQLRAIELKRLHEAMLATSKVYRYYYDNSNDQRLDKKDFFPLTICFNDYTLLSEKKDIETETILRICFEYFFISNREKEEKEEKKEKPHLKKHSGDCGKNVSVERLLNLIVEEQQCDHLILICDDTVQWGELEEKFVSSIDYRLVKGLVILYTTTGTPIEQTHSNNKPALIYLKGISLEEEILHYYNCDNDNDKGWKLKTLTKLCGNHTRCLMCFSVKNKKINLIMQYK